MPSLFAFSYLVSLLALSFLTFDHPLILLVESNLDSDKDALISFRSQLSLDNPSNNPLSSWDQNLSPCNWTRVVCNKFGDRVIGLNLSSLQLIGQISPHIGNLSFLQSLQLQNNQLTNTIPKEECNLLQLKVLNLSSNKLEGSIPSNIGKLRELEVLDLTMNKISGRIPNEVSLLPKLQVLNLASNTFFGSIPPSLGNVTSMTNLDLGTNTISGTIPMELSYLRNLKHLDLSINNLSGTVPSPMYNMSSLEFFALASNDLWGELPYNIGETLPNLLDFNFCINKFTGRIPGSLHNLTNIKEIRMAHNRLTGTIPPGLGNLPRLKMYNIGYNYIENSGEDNGLDFITLLANSTELNFLAFDGNLLKGVIPESIGNLSKVLSKLYMGGNQIHGTIPSSIAKLTGLTLLNISYNEITGPIPSEISHLQDLQVLDLSHNHISEAIPDSFGSLIKLTKLDLSSNSLVGQVPCTFGGYSSLTYMDLSTNMLNGTIPREIFNLPSLSNTLNMSHNHFDGHLPDDIEQLTIVISLDLSSNRLSGNIPSSISNCKSLETLSLARNFFSGSIPNSFGSLKALQTLDLSHNQLSSSIPSNLELSTQSLNLSYNNLEGEIPCGGILGNLSRVYLQGNPRLSLQSKCGGSHHHKRRLRKAGIVVAIVAVLVLFFIAGLYLAIRKRKARSSSKTSDSKMQEGHYMVKYDELRQATGGFSEANLIGSGSFGSVYKGCLQDNITVAIKEFLALVYEFLSNGSLEVWIKGKRKKENGDGLGFLERLNVTIDVASALDYLHHDSEVPVVHCDIKPSNILLDEDMTANIGDFGLARLLMEQIGGQHSISSSHVMKGSIGYMPPEYGLGAKPSTAGDTYSFGVTLLELFTAKSPSNESFTGEQESFDSQLKIDDLEQRRVKILLTTALTVATPN
uniref:non-specific serine/threonine protein kinase n=1 Tax=Chenopodium quinoa TaxID=63459 RepID=A0A803MJ41_CHEQI